MPSFTLSDVTVNFPFPPYGCQKDYMKKVIECLQKMQNGVLESPTGTGKTLCLLCATLGWRENFKDSISARKIPERLAGAYVTDVPKIIYASRTHSQLAQVISELKKTSYRPKVCVLGSREQLCINQEVTRQENNHVKVHMCRRKVSTRSCLYYNNVEEKRTGSDLVNSIMDVEDLVKFANKERVCPYYLSQSLSKQADVIFMPYNYLLDPKCRRVHNIELNGAVIIIDEAHNVDKTCEESTSFDLTPYDVDSAISALDRLQVDMDKEALSWDSEDFTVEVSSSGILLDLQTEIDSYDVPADKGITKPGSFIYELLERAHLTYSYKTKVLEALEHILGYFAEMGMFLKLTGLQKLSDIIQLVFCGEPAEINRQQQMQTNTANFRVHIHKDTNYHRQKQTTDMWASSSLKKQGNVLSYWCFSPGFSMQDLVNQGVRCIILTSGSLSPLTSFVAEMRIPFPVSLENRHVIEQDQIFVSIIERGPDRVYLSSALDRCHPVNMASLGNTVANLCRVVPHGLLVFFPSLPLMEKTLEFWRVNGHADRIGKIKPMFVEPKGKETFMEIINGYYNKVNDTASKGRSFLAVCQGTATEGLDFADTFGRGVIITGPPFPPRMDPRVILKMQFLDEMCRKKVPGLKYLSGHEWYNQQAYRAVNQVIGRVICHKEDFAAIFLCDQRFKHSDARAQLPSWVRPYVRVHDSFGNVVRDVCQFFRVAQKLRPVVENKAAAAGDENSTCFPGTSSFSPSQSASPQNARTLDAHTPSLKRRRINMQTGSDAMASICIECECLVHGSYRIPVNLLDALKRCDEHREEDNDAAVGEEKNDKRMDDEMRGGKRKIKQGQQSEDSKANSVTMFLAEVKKSLNQVTFDSIIEALQMYKTTDNLYVLDILLTETSIITHNLICGFYQFVRPHHKKMFHEKCRELTGQGCGYKPHHSLPNDQKKMLLQQSAKDKPFAVGLALSSGTSACTELNTKQLSRRIHHLMD